jgi:GMP synthase-like glutamine amidotransferase
VELARNDACLQAFRLEGKPAWGVQFHAEVTGPDLGSWLDAWAEDEGAVRSGLDAEAIRAETEQRIGAQNELGRELAARFVAEARAVAATRG